MAKRTRPPQSDVPARTAEARRDDAGHIGAQGGPDAKNSREAPGKMLDEKLDENSDAGPITAEPDGMTGTAKAPVQPAEADEADAGAIGESPAREEHSGEALSGPGPDSGSADTGGGAPGPEQTAAAPAPRGPGILSLLAGGVLAAVIGFGAARFVIPEGWPFGPVSQATRTLTEAVDDQATRIGTLGAKLDATAQTAAAADGAAKAAEVQAAELFAGLNARLDDLETRTAPLQDAASRVVAFDQRLTALERQPAQDGSASKAAIESFQRELTDLRQMLEAERARNAAAEAEAEARANAVQAEAATLARQAARDAAFAQLSQGLASGGSLTGAVAALTAAGVAVPEALAAHAAAGVPTLESLQKGFAQPARAALAASADAGNAGQIGAFLRTQFGVRSLTPRDGDSPDAILSRAEAAARAGDLARAITALKSLPEAGQAAMAGWIEAASARQAMVEAAATLAPQ